MLVIKKRKKEKNLHSYTYTKNILYTGIHEIKSVWRTEEKEK